MSEDLHRVIARVRRAMPRNEDVMAICDALETKLTNRGTKKAPHDGGA